MNKTKTIGDIIYTNYRTYKIVDIIGDELVLKYIYTDEDRTRIVKIEDIRKIEATMISIISNLSSLYDEDYPYLVVDLENNIAFSKIPHSEFVKLSKTVEDYAVFYHENIKMMFYDQKYYIENKDSKYFKHDIIVLPKLVSEFLNTYNLWMWETDLKSRDFYNLLDMMRNKNFGYTYDSFMDSFQLYKDTEFIK